MFINCGLLSEVIVFEDLYNERMSYINIQIVIIIVIFLSGLIIMILFNWLVVIINIVYLSLYGRFMMKLINISCYIWFGRGKGFSSPLILSFHTFVFSHILQFLMYCLMSLDISGQKYWFIISLYIIFFLECLVKIKI